jgi:hypothetical protein
VGKIAGRVGAASPRTGAILPTRLALSTAQTAWANARIAGAQIAGARFQHHIGAAPGLIVDQPPFVAAADIVLGEEHVARPHDELLAVTRGEFEGARERDHELPLGCVVPIERRVRRRLLEMDRDHVGAVVLGDRPLDDMRGFVRAGVKLESVQHVDLMTSL